jgi:hypothetical protein
MMELPPQEQAVYDELGADEVRRRVNGLPPHRTYRTLVDVAYGIALTPQQMLAFLFLAAAFGKDAVIMNNSIVIPMTEEEKTRAVLRDETEKRKGKN